MLFVDIVERFQQSAFLFIITLRNIIELSESGPSSILPSTFVPLFKLPASTSINTLMTPIIMVLLSEIMVDWLKHAFITKFNQIRPSIYGKYIDILCKDLVIGSPSRMASKNHAFVDQSPVVSRRIGFPVLPLACLVSTLLLLLLLLLLFNNIHFLVCAHDAANFANDVFIPKPFNNSQYECRRLYHHQRIIKLFDGSSRRGKPSIASPYPTCCAFNGEMWMAGKWTR
jgi:hypothetical protein